MVPAKNNLLRGAGYGAIVGFVVPLVCIGVGNWVRSNFYLDATSSYYLEMFQLFIWPSEFMILSAGNQTILNLVGLFLSASVNAIFYAGLGIAIELVINARRG
jgi:hypothetical protein